MAVKLTYVEGVYEDREDSWLLQKIVQERAKGKYVLDVGCGTGIQGITACKSGAKKVVCIDVNPRACALTRKNAEINECDVEVVCGNLIDGLREIKFDLILFNAPYLPYEDEDITWSGGKDLILKFIEQAKNFVKSDGEILFVFSSYTKLPLNDIEIVAEKKVNFETLYVGKVSFL